MSAAAIALIVVGVVAIIVILILAVKLAAATHAAEDGVTRMREQFDGVLEDARKEARKAAAKGSRAVILGGISQQMAPMLPDFRYEPKDVQWVGGVIDAIVWDGLASGGDIEVVFLEVKTGTARLTEGQKRVREAVKDKRVRFDVYRPPLPAPPVKLELPGSPDGNQQA